jgi:hypothetical protein
MGRVGRDALMARMSVSSRWYSSRSICSYLHGQRLWLFPNLTTNSDQRASPSGLVLCI